MSLSARHASDLTQLICLGASWAWQHGQRAGEQIDGRGSLCRLAPPPRRPLVRPLSL